MADLTFANFEEFWPFYVLEHSNGLNRALHFVGTSMAMGCVAAAALTGNPLLLPVAAVAGYAPAWVGHFFVEKNRPASFKFPLWSLRGDLRMWGLFIRGRMSKLVEELEHKQSGLHAVA